MTETKLEKVRWMVQAHYADGMADLDDVTVRTVLDEGLQLVHLAATGVRQLDDLASERIRGLRTELAQCAQEAESMGHRYVDRIEELERALDWAQKWLKLHPTMPGPAQEALEQVAPKFEQPLHFYCTALTREEP